ncbi:SPOR domain-containing protein [Mesobacillus maritimus]|uniref:SPOR domain-containing protein n=1 Tax=Mesobacillus maritimus TaxID=1643336 RepID=A0ABS7KA20_9BACI|nr:SPOR domain-containing protein [Mesobacillus maritimus]MBY0099124.1 SPOR domain-containing protein [Mesobacillus maritimus]
MDKHKTITIKINGKERPHKDEEPKSNKDTESTTQSEAKPKIKAWNETAAAKESADDSFDWVLPEVSKEDGNDFQVVSKPKDTKQRGFRLPGLPQPPNKKRGNSSGVFPRIALNILFAVVLGLGFGMIILNTVKPDAVETVVPATTAPAKDKPAEGGTGTESVELPTLSTFVVQGGAFSTEESANTAGKELEGKGIDAQAVSVNGQFLLLLGMAGSLEDAKVVGAEFASKGAEVFSKPLEVGGFSVEGLTKEESSVLTIAPELFAILSGGDYANSKDVEDQLAKLKKVDEAKINNKEIKAAKKNLEKGATAFLAKDNSGVQKESLAFLASWQSLGK